MSEESKMVRLHVSMPPEEVEAVDTYRFANRIGSRAEAIRQLVKKGLESAEKK